MKGAGPSLPSDFELLDRWRADDQDAGNQLFQRHLDSVYQFFESKLGGDEVGDLVQRTFLACVRSRDVFRKQSSFRTYMFAIARNELYSFFRRKVGSPIDFELRSAVDLGTSPSVAAARGQRQVALIEALRSLAVDQQLILELHYWEDFDAGELGEVLGIDRTTARTRLHRARKQLRVELERRGHGSWSEP
ncbi:ECF RNA polymerase sigma-E factor [Enhygromyxa salina]|uniref:ECF RNA polymerase sigma-E factor n=1 Tax=Enhygromyxa salina TaxID=215803 RepID=A0A2S9YCJ9_9BACT|nr:sigma-70 family RNA polymerase sigma factor [Enhygromyxa salina]PRQ02825.1 ECF RNA polymerase sigma-E factor [Enhygromyxa salina]